MSAPAAIADDGLAALVRTDKIVWRRADGIGTLVFNNPQKHNAISLEMWEATAHVLEAFASDPAVRVIVLTGAGEKAFVSGADISKFETERATRDAVVAYNTTQERVHGIMYRLRKPIIARIRGYCLGGGLGLAVSCDIRICADTARLGIPAAKLGNCYAFGGIKRLVDLVGPAFAKEIFFTGRRFGARECYEKGLVSQVVPEAELDDFVAAYAGEIAENAPLSIEAARYAVAQAMADATARDLKGCDDFIDRCADSRDYVEGRRAFMEKRKPVFTGS